MTALLTDNLPLLASAPNGIKKLRELVLELAVRGKLVPQDPSDEPASELLKRIAEEKARLVSEGKIRKPKELADTPDQVITFPLPAGWAATSIGEVTICRDGERVPVSQAEREGRGKVFDYYGASGVIDKIDGYLFDKPLLLVGEDGANLINRSTPIAFIARGRYWVNNHAHVLDGVSEELLFYIELYFNAIDLKPYVTGTAQPKMNQSKMNGIPVGLPPLAEQNRIVAKVDELMALCDRLEAQQADAESAHAQVVQALLDSLTQASDANDFAANWQRLAEHFHTLFTTESSIDALKQTLLQLAVMGKLVPQDSSDEPASELLNRIADEKARLVAEGKLKKQKPIAGIDEKQKPFELPAGWEWTQLGQISSDVQYGFTASANHQKGEPLFLRITDIQDHGVNWESVPGCDISPAETAGYELKDGDIVIARTGGTIGKSYLVSGLTHSAVFASYLIRIGRLDTIYPNFTKVFLGAQLYWKQLYANSMGTGQPNVNGTALKGLLFPLAPMAEQHRIVAKVDQLMTLCDQIKARLTEARQLNEQLASTLAEQATN